MRNFIEAVKQDKFTTKVKDSFVNFVQGNIDSAQGVILGCTELPVMYGKCKERLGGINFYDPMIITLEKLKEEFDATEHVNY